MIESTWQGNEFGKMFETWIETSKNFWQLDAREEKTVSEPDLNVNSDKKDTQGDASDKYDDGSQYKTYRSWEAAVNNFTTFMRVMAEPENQKNLGNSLITFSEVMTQAAGDALENLTEFQGQVVNSFAKVNEHTKAYNFDDIDHSAFESFRELYRSEFQKYLNMPKIGLPREFHERLSNLADSSTLFNSYLTELLYLFSLPFEKTNRVMQEKISHKMEEGDFEYLKDSKKTYGEWIKTLEGNFTELLNSSEYTAVLNKTIVSLADCKNVRQEVMGGILKDLQIPTNKEMDDVYKDLYQMKKKIRQLTSQVESLQAQLMSSREQELSVEIG